MAGFGSLLQRGVVRFERRLPGPIERVWAYLKEPEKRARWLAGGEMELRVGGRVELRFRHADLSPIAAPTPERFATSAEANEVHGTVTACESPHRLAFTWGEGGDRWSEVPFELEAVHEGVRLTVTHRRLGDEPATWANVAGGWHTHLAILEDRLEGRVPQPFFPAFEPIEAAYLERFGAPVERARETLRIVRRYPDDMAATVPSLVERVLPVLRRYGARRAGLFGSYARGEADAVSDLDLLVELPPGASLLDLIGLEQDLSDELGLKVEATTCRALHPQLRDRVLRDEIRIL